MFKISYLPYGILSESKAISYEFSEFHIVSELFMIIFMDTITILLIGVGLFIVILALLECCRPSGKKKKFKWIQTAMRICVEYITFNAFLRWFHEFSLVLFIAALFNIRINPFAKLHWVNILSYSMAVIFLIASAFYVVWMIFYFRKSRRPVNIDIPVGAIHRRSDKG